MVKVNLFRYQRLQLAGALPRGPNLTEIMSLIIGLITVNHVDLADEFLNVAL
jgi:hypothetical protein